MMSVKRALVVDDSKSVRLMLGRMLEQNRLTVDTAETAEEALEYLRGTKPDVIFMDHILPGMNGLDATKAITADPATATIPVVVHSSKDGEVFTQQAEAHGAACVLPKPAKPDALSQVLKTLQVLPEPAAAPPASGPRRPVTPAVPAISTAMIESLARSTAEAVVQSAVQSTVLRLLEEQLAPLKQELLARGRMTAGEIAEELYATRANELANRIRMQVHEQLADIQATLDAPKAADGAMLAEVESLARAVAAETAAESAAEAAQDLARRAAQSVAEQTAEAAARRGVEERQGARLLELTDQMRQLQQQLAEIQRHVAEPRSLDAGAHEEITHVAKAVAAQTAADAATQAAQKAVTQSAQRIAQTAGDVTRRVVEPLIDATRAQTSRMYLLAGAAAAAGMLTAVILNLLR